VLDRDGADVPGLVEVYLRVLVEILGFRNRDRAELDIERVGIVKISDLHG
jgi:hypothetical protein